MRIIYSLPMLFALFSLSVSGYVSIELIDIQGRYNRSEIQTFRENGTQFGLTQEKFTGNYSIFYEFFPLGLDRTEFSYVICQDNWNVETKSKCILTNDSIHDCSPIPTTYASSEDTITVDVKLNGTTPLETFRKCAWYSSYGNKRLIIYHPTSTIYEINVDSPPSFNIVSYISNQYRLFFNHIIDIINTLWNFAQIALWIIAFVVIPTVGIVVLVVVFRKVVWWVKQR